jgi:hypothetical protein
MDGGFFWRDEAGAARGWANGDGDNSFAQLYRQAHQKVGMNRLGVAAILDWLTQRGGDADGLDAVLHDGTPMTPDNRDRVKGNLFLSFLFHDLRGRLDAQMRLCRAQGLGPFQPMPYGLSQAQKLNWLRSQSCIALNQVLEDWAAAVQMRPLSACPFARMARFAKSFFKGSSLYRRAEHDMVSISKTGSNTALHMCFSLVEAALRLQLEEEGQAWRAVLWRSRKELKTLASGSLGMIVTFLHASQLEPEGESAVNPTAGETCAFYLDEGPDGARLRLDPGPIRPFSTGHDRVYTGCPAFHVAGMIEMYLEWVLDIALAHGLDTNPEGRPATAALMGLRTDVSRVVHAAG